MKPSKIQRGIVSRHARTESEALGLGRVSRLRDLDLPRGAARLHSDGGSSSEMQTQRGRMILTWSLIFIFTTVVVLGACVIFWLCAHKNVKAAAVAQPEAAARIVSQFVSPSEDQALDLVKQALANRDPAKVETFFRLGGANPAEVVEFLAGSAARDGRIERCVWLSSMDVEGLLLEGVLVVYAGKATPGERLAFLTPDDTGVWKVDFDAFARSNRPSWKDFMEGRADHAQVRVFTAKDTYFNGAFQDESRWVCYVMGSPESKGALPGDPHLLLGYCKKGSRQAMAMERIFAGGELSNRVTLEICRKEGADERQFEITRVLAQDWVLPGKPFDEKFH